MRRAPWCELVDWRYERVVRKVSLSQNAHIPSLTSIEMSGSTGPYPSEKREFHPKFAVGDGRLGSPRYTPTGERRPTTY